MQQYNRWKDEAEQHLLRQRQEVEALAAKQGLDESLDKALLDTIVLIDVVAKTRPRCVHVGTDFGI